jgi:hypothetical protein
MKQVSSEEVQVFKLLRVAMILAIITAIEVID